MTFKRKWINPTNGGHDPLYHVWSDMVRRCTQPSCQAYPDYGGRGITVCPRWIDNFDAFVEDVGAHPGKGWTFDRMINADGYHPGNWQWATRKEQNRNRRLVKLSQAIARQMRAAYASGGVTHKSLADQFGVVESAVFCVINGKTWRE